jgi:acyl dehydratase
LEGPDEVRAAVGRELGTSDWAEVGAAEAELFLEAAPDPMVPTGTIPPLLILSLTNLFLPQIIEVHGFSAGVNYGTGSVRFGPPLPVDVQLRARATLDAVEDVKGGLQTTIGITVEAEGFDEPACVVESLSRWLV